MNDVVREFYIDDVADETVILISYHGPKSPWKNSEYIITVKRQFRLLMKSKDLDKSLIGKLAITTFKLIKRVNSINVSENN